MGCSADMGCSGGRHLPTTGPKLKILIFGVGGSSIRPLGTIKWGLQLRKGAGSLRWRSSGSEVEGRITLLKINLGVQIECGNAHSYNETNYITSHYEISRVTS